MSPDIEFPRWEGVKPLFTDQKVPDYMATQYMAHQDQLSRLASFPKVHERFGVTEQKEIPIVKVYTDTVYTNHFRKFDVYTQSGVYMFYRPDAIMYVGQSSFLGDRLRGHITNYQRDGIESRSPFVGFSRFVRVYFTPDYLELEKFMIAKLKPVWNGFANSRTKKTQAQ